MKIIIEVPEETVTELDARLAGYASRSECIRAMIRRFIAEVAAKSKKMNEEICPFCSIGEHDKCHHGMNNPITGVLIDCKCPLCRGAVARSRGI